MEALYDFHCIKGTKLELPLIKCQKSWGYKLSFLVHKMQYRQFGEEGELYFLCCFKKINDVCLNIHALSQ